MLAGFAFSRFFPAQRTQLTCSGEISAFYLAGIPRGDEGNTFTIHQWRRDPNLSLVQNAVLTVRTTDIETTENPNLYRVITPLSLFRLRVNDSLSITYSNTPENRDIGSMFDMSFISQEDLFALKNTEIPGRTAESISNFPLMSLQVSGNRLLQYNNGLS